MSVISSFYNTTAQVIRTRTSSATLGDTVTTVSTATAGLLRPVTNRAQLLNGNNWGQEYDWVCDDSANIMSGDDLYIGGVRYTVQGVMNPEDLIGDVDSHLDVRVLRRPNGQ